MDKEKIGINLRNLRREHGLTQEELATRTDTSTGHIQHTEKGYESISLHLLIKFCNALDVTPNDILAGLYKTEGSNDSKPQNILLMDGIRPDDRMLLQYICNMLRNAE